jgi:hypothetical protein
MSKTDDFPVFRKYKNDSSFFKILSADEFEEIKKLPKGYGLFKFKAKILPDRNYIHDMLYDFHLHWLEIEEMEYEEAKGKMEDQ